MKIQVLSENLQKKLPFVFHGISIRSQLPVLSNFLLEAKNGILTISATDLEIGIQTEIEVSIEEEGGITVPAKVFVELISSLSPGKTTINTDGQIIEIKNGKTKSTLQTISKEEFPKLYEDKGEKFTQIEKEIIEKDLAKVVFAATTDEGRPSLSGVLFKRKDSQDKSGFLLVATDGYRLSLKEVASIKKETKANDVEKTQALIPARILREVVGMKEEGDLEIFISGKNNQILFLQGGTLLVGRLIEAEFPAYEKIIPQDFTTKTMFNKEDLYRAVKTCSIFARETANIVKFSIKNSSITVSANTPSIGENVVEIDAQISGEENNIAFNARYLLELLSNIEEEEVIFEMTGPLSPGVFKVKDDPTFLHLIMPIRVQAEN